MTKIQDAIQTGKRKGRHDIVDGAAGERENKNAKASVHTLGEQKYQNKSFTERTIMNLLMCTGEPTHLARARVRSSLRKDLDGEVVLFKEVLQSQTAVLHAS